MYTAKAKAHANLAFVKYWGKKDFSLNIPSNGSISMNLSNAITITEVSFLDELSKDEVFMEGKNVSDTSFSHKVSKHLDRVRALAGTSLHARVTTENSFPTGAGFASSASGFAALTLASTRALGIDLSERELSALARQGSGSACRSIPSGFVEWIGGDSHDTSYSVQLFPPDYWNIVDVAVVVSGDAKDISSSEGHKLALDSPFWTCRQETINRRLEKVRDSIKNRDFRMFGREVEEEAISLHAISLSSSYIRNGNWYSGIYYWSPDTLEILLAVQKWRANGLDVYFTLDAGPTVHLICEEENKDDVVLKIKDLMKNRNWGIIVNNPAQGATIL